MALTLKQYLNVFEKELQISPSSGARFTLPSFYQGDVVPMQIHLLEPDPAGDFNSFLKPDISNMSLKFAVSDQPVGDAAESPFVTEFDWDKNTTDKYFFADVNFNTPALTTWLGSEYSKPAYLEIEVTEGNAIWTVFQKLVTIVAEVIEPASSEVAAGQTPLSLEMANGMFVPYRLPPGRTITFVSTAETGERILGVEDDGNAIDQAYAV